MTSDAGRVPTPPDEIDNCPTHGTEFIHWGLTCLACEAEEDPARAAELAGIGIDTPASRRLP